MNETDSFVPDEVLQRNERPTHSELVRAIERFDLTTSIVGGDISTTSLLERKLDESNPESVKISEMLATFLFSSCTDQELRALVRLSDMINTNVFKRNRFQLVQLARDFGRNWRFQDILRRTVIVPFSLTEPPKTPSRELLQPLIDFAIKHTA